MVTVATMNDRDKFKGIPMRHLLSLVMFFEARNQGIEGMVAVGCVARNRTKYRSKGYKDVLLEPKQFSCLDSVPWYMWETYNAQGLNLDPLEKRIFEQCLFIAGGIITEVIVDNTNGSDHYFAHRWVRPWWARKMSKTVRIRDHMFLKS